MKCLLPVSIPSWIRAGLLLLLIGLSLTTSRAQTPLQLPFFEDFSTAAGYPGIDKPSSARWQPGSGVYINNTMAVNHPTVGVASFDGLNASGKPYVQNNQLAQGYTDTLTSLPIDLSGLTKADNAYLSFYWQSRGLGEAPDPGDSLTVQFLLRSGVWKTVWTQEGGTPSNNFAQAFIEVDTSLYMHAGFAFRFRSYGRESGPFDTWNIDYIYLNKNRNADDRFVRDVAMRQALTPLLRRYTAMPLSQYVVNPAAEMADSVRTDINNLFNNFNFTTFRFTVRDEVSGRLLQDTPQNKSEQILSLSSQRKAAQPLPVLSFGTSTSAVLRYTFNVLTTDDQNPSIPGVNLRQNDTLSARTTLADYYAYDDGTWEYGVQVGPRERWAVRFVVSKPDVLAGFRACIVPFRTNQSGQLFSMFVYSNANGRPGNPVYQQTFTTQYPATRNGFVDFTFTKGVAVSDTFYIGYQQISSVDTTIFRLGFDKNSPFGNQLFYNGGASWEQNLNPNSPSLALNGAFMIRPVMGGKIDTTPTAEEPEQLELLAVYPNPTTGQIRWDNPRLRQIDVVSSSGQLIQRIEPGRGQQTADLSQLPGGFYVLRLSTDRQTVTQKLILQH